MTARIDTQAQPQLGEAGSPTKFLKFSCIQSGTGDNEFLAEALRFS